MKKSHKEYYFIVLILSLCYIQLQLPIGLRHLAWPLDSLVLIWYIYSPIKISFKKSNKTRESK